MMDPSIETGLNKVTVECTDPSGLFPGVQSVLSKRLPLKNLHWKSPTRPARSIESLNVDLAVSQAPEEKKRVSNDAAGTGGGAAASSPAAPLRRHQIPGLRQTPYLRIYLLRCDDNETYKTSARKSVREWIKAHSASQQTSGAGHGNHDACEWLILHVLQDGDAPEKTASKWPGRGSTSILEKVKADFNGSSKGAVDRVAQIRLPKEEGQTQAQSQDQSELIDQLNDLVDKVKHAILTSFDLRVAQYEEDIKEKDSQRSLPGWNFCTFFILKEGLARGFENVGLLEDALVGYDELAAGLESAVTSYLSGTGDQHGGGFLDFSADRKEKAIAAIEKQKSASEAESDGNDKNTGKPTLDLDEEHFPLDSAKKPYREMILANNISIFDFRTYVFSRQLNILLKAARAPCIQNKRNSNQGTASSTKGEDLLLLAEICDRAMEFISTAARTLRYDIECALSDVTEAADVVKKTAVINNLVSSWTYAAVCQVLSQTASPSLVLPESPLQQAKSSKKPTAVADVRSNVPRRSSSLITPGTGHGESDGAASTHKAAVAKAGSSDLSSGRGELCQLARGVLEEIGERRGWVQKWSDFDVLFDKPTSILEEGMEEVSLDDENSSTQENENEPQDLPPALRMAGIDLPALSDVLQAREQFYLLIEECTDQMFRHYDAANRTRSAETALAEIAVLKFRQEDFETAAIFFRKIAPFYENCQWPTLEGTILELYTRCLKRLGRGDDFVRILLRLLSQYASYIQSGLSTRQKSSLASSNLVVQSNVHEYIEELFEASAKLTKELNVPLSSFFGDIDVDPEIKHYSDRDGFQMQLKLRFLLGDVINIKSVKVRLVNASGLLSHEVWLESSEEAVIKSSASKLLVGSTSTLQGKYIVDRIEMRVKNLVFTYGGGSHSSALPPGFREPEESEATRPYIWCYSAASGLDARLTTPQYINLEGLRTVEVEIDSGHNNISSGVVRVRPATAGLRLRIAEAAVVDGDINMTPNPESGTLEFTNFSSESSVRLRIPYSIDEEHTTLSTRLEVVYETDNGRFTYVSTSSIISTLPISVNVQDVFKDDVLFSRFTVSPAMLIPLRVLGCNIPESTSYQVDGGVQGAVAFDVFPKQPASVIYKIRLRESGARLSGDSKRSLRLTVQFTCLDEECLLLIKQKFVAAITDSKFKSLVRLLTPHIVEAFRSQLSSSDMEAIGLVREVQALSYNQVHWETVLSGLREPFRKEVRDWLVEWHQANTIFTLGDPDPALLARQIVIPVEVPEIQVVHTAELRLLTESLSGHGQASHHHHNQHAYAAVGHMIPAELVLRHTRRWCSKKTESEEANKNSLLEFAYEMQVNPDLWLIGGRRRGHFTAQEGEDTTFALMLLPQRAGNLLLPSIEIKTYLSEGVAATTATTTSSSSSSSLTVGNTTTNNVNKSQVNSPGTSSPSPWSTQQQRRPVPSEVDYKNHGETLLVLPDLKKTTVSLESGSPGLIASEARLAV